MSSQLVEKRYQQEHPRLVSTFNEVCDVALDEPGFWVSKPWLKGKCPSGIQPAKALDTNSPRLETRETEDAHSLPR